MDLSSSNKARIINKFVDNTYIVFKEASSFLLLSCRCVFFNEYDSMHHKNYTKGRLYLALDDKLYIL